MNSIPKVVRATPISEIHDSAIRADEVAYIAWADGLCASDNHMAPPRVQVCQARGVNRLQGSSRNLAIAGESRRMRITDSESCWNEGFVNAGVAWLTRHINLHFHYSFQNSLVAWEYHPFFVVQPELLLYQLTSELSILLCRRRTPVSYEIYQVRDIIRTISIIRLGNEDFETPTAFE